MRRTAAITMKEELMSCKQDSTYNSSVVLIENGVFRNYEDITDDDLQISDDENNNHDCNRIKVSEFALRTSLQQPQFPVRGKNSIKKRRWKPVVQKSDQRLFVNVLPPILQEKVKATLRLRCQLREFPKKPNQKQPIEDSQNRPQYLTKKR